jgi:hypothetical protein
MAIHWNLKTFFFAEYFPKKFKNAVNYRGKALNHGGTKAPRHKDMGKII